MINCNFYSVKCPKRTWCQVTISMMFVCFLTAGATAATRYFQVAEWPGREHHGDSYVLPLTRTGDIAHAEELINLGPEQAGDPIIVANIAAGRDGINRDFNQAGNPEWSWHVTEFVTFASFTIEILDGWPTFVESDVDFWINNTGGQIGFWGYTVVADVTHLIPEPGTLVVLAISVVGLGRRTRRFADSASACD